MAPSVVIEEPVPEPEPETPIAIEASAPPGTVALAKVLHDYQATADEELSFAEGDTIYVLVKVQRHPHSAPRPCPNVVVAG
jgi:hypothetical protein